MGEVLADALRSTEERRKGQSRGVRLHPRVESILDETNAADTREVGQEPEEEASCSVRSIRRKMFVDEISVSIQVPDIHRYRQ